MRKQWIPWMMAGGRAALAPVMILGARSGWNGEVLAAIVIATLFSDIFDGVLARRWRCDTAGVRLFDSLADILFYGGVAAALCIRTPQLITHNAAALSTVIGLEVVRLGFDLAKFGKPASYHSWLAKSWGLVLAVAVVLAFAGSGTGAAVRVCWSLALALGLACELESAAMSLILPEWRKDVRTIRYAFELRAGMLRSPSPAGRGCLRVCKWSALGCGLLLLIPVPVHASTIGPVKFIGGSAPGLAAGTEGTLETDTDSVRFQSRGTALAIAYDQIQDFSYREKPAVHLGALPALVVLLLRPSIYRHILSLSYLDASGTRQVAVFEVPKQADDTLPIVLQERSGICADRSQVPCRNLAPPLSSIRLRRAQR